MGIQLLINEINKERQGILVLIECKSNHKIPSPMDTLLTILKPVLPTGMNLSLRKCIVSVLWAMIVTWSVNILKLASEFVSGAKVPSVVRRLERLLSRRLIRQHDAARAIIDAIPGNGRFILSMDGTSWKLGKFKYYVLAVGICFDGISLPICFLFLPGADITSFVEEIQIMESVVSIVGRQRIECLLADREFGNTNFIKWLQLNHIQYCLRLRENLYVRKEGQKKGRMLRDLLSPLRTGESAVLRDVYLIRRNTRVRIYATRRTARDGEESLIILASPLECDYTETLYKKRWTLETAFRGLKTAGFNMEDTHLGEERFRNMLTLLMIAFAAAFIEGLLRVNTLPIPLMKNRNVKRISIFRYGYVSLLHEFWANVKNVSVLST